MISKCAFKVSIVLVFIFFFSENSYAQSNTNSPYSRAGLGDLARTRNVRSIGMGGVGISMGGYNYLNLHNPALLSQGNRATIFDAGGMVEYKSLQTNEASQTDFGGNLTYLGFAMPFTDKWTFGFGFVPFSKVSYSAVSYAKIEGAPTFVEYTYNGRGGVNRLFASSGYRVHKNLALGAEISYNFGSLQAEQQSRLDDGTSQYIVELFDRNNFGDASYKVGAHYRVPLNDDYTYFNVGATYDFQTNLNSKEFRAFQRKSISGLIVAADTLYEERESSVVLPSTVGFGLSIEKRMAFSLGIDVEMGNWSEFSGLAADSLANTLLVAVGGSWTPDASSTLNYLERITYRAGVRYEETPFVFNGEQLNDMSISLGFSLPTLKPDNIYESLSRLNMAFVFGRRGTMSNSLIQETYFRFHLGASINQRWFVRRRFD